MKEIQVDLEVYEALVAHRARGEVTDNDTLRRIFGLQKRQETAIEDSAQVGDWIVKGVRFPAGTELRAKYEGKTYLARVENGALILNGERFSTPSAAAVSIAKMTVNGWLFWKCRMPGKMSWRPLKALRRSSELGPEDYINRIT